MTGAKLVFGAALLSSAGGFQSAEDIKPFLDTIEEVGIKTIDTAQIYNESEPWLGENNASSRFIIDTKHPGGAIPTTPATKDVIIADGKESLKKLATNQVDIYYLHSPEPRVPFEDTLAGINELYKAGAFRRFGLSNFTPDEVEEVIRISNERGYVLPSVYQGNYNAFARLTEENLIPLLRKHKISFYAYSPIAGGFLAKDPEDIRNKTLTGRWDPETFFGKMYYTLYGDKSAFLDALIEWRKIAADSGISPVELAFRWVVHNSALDGSLGDAAVIGARNQEQLRETVAAINKGPLSAEAQSRVEALWAPLKPEAFADNFEAVKKIIDDQQKLEASK